MMKSLGVLGEDNTVARKIKVKLPLAGGMIETTKSIGSKLIQLATVALPSDGRTAWEIASELVPPHS
jgi:hypothetical protein